MLQLSLSASSLGGKMDREHHEDDSFEIFLQKKYWFSSCSLFYFLAASG